MGTQQDEQLKEIIGLLRTLGYDLTKEESKVFVDVVVEALDQLNSGKTIEDIHELIMDKNKSPIYVELAYFIYEKGMPHIHQSLEQFQACRQEKNSNKQVFDAVFFKKANLNAYDAAYYVVRYLNDESHEKSIIKTKCMFGNVK